MIKEPTKEELLARLLVLHKKLEDEGMYVRANTVWLAKEYVEKHP
jgi:hypothetical protein